MDRQKIIDAFSGNPVAGPLVEDLLYLDDRIAELKKLPFIRVHPTNKAMQKPTEAAKQCKELIALRCTIARTLAGMVQAGDGNGTAGLGEEDRKRIRAAMLEIASASEIRPKNVRAVTRYDAGE